MRFLIAAAVLCPGSALACAEPLVEVRLYNYTPDEVIGVEVVRDGEPALPLAPELAAAPLLPGSSALACAPAGDHDVVVATAERSMTFAEQTIRDGGELYFAE